MLGSGRTAKWKEKECLPIKMGSCMKDSGYMIRKVAGAY